MPQVPDQPTARALYEGDRSDTAAQQDLGSIWQAVTERLRVSVPDATFRLWLEPLRAAAAQGDTLYVKAPDGIRAWVERRYAALISAEIGRAHV